MDYAFVFISHKGHACILKAFVHILFHLCFKNNVGFCITHCKSSKYDALPSLRVNPLEGSPKCSCGKRDSEGAPDFQHYKGLEGRARSPEIRLGRETSRSSLNLHPKQTTKWLVHIPGHPWALGQATGTLDHKTHHGPDSGEATTFPHIVFSTTLC
jgi:hypothetical protein